MSYQVLARKWRPRRFSELVGQTHVVRPLSNALASDRVHHALLFTGTRGVGKTTLARIFAKALNCDSGVGPEPCGACPACEQIDAGRFVDLIEIDAASRTKVEDTRELLDNVQYAPSQGRFKVYLIDEVHMLSRHSFNALLKTLEEPPPHVKFVLATTDPQRLPVTILSRCLQFNLKRLPARLIGDHLGAILEREGIAAEAAALGLIARAGDGSMRDALTLLDQAIAFGGGRVETAAVSAMLGSVDPQHVPALLRAMADGDAASLLAQVAELDQQAPDYINLLGELLAALQRIAVLQWVPQAPQDEPDDEILAPLAAALSPEDVQLYYQIALLGRRDLPLAPEPRSGFEMLLLRMLCFTPESDDRPRPEMPAERPTIPTSSRSRPAPAPSAPAPSARPAPTQAPLESPPESPMPENGALDWGRLIERAGVTGMVGQLARNCTVDDYCQGLLTLRLAEAHAGLRTERLEAQLCEALARELGADLRLRFRVGEPQSPTPAQHAAQHQTQRREQAAALIDDDPNVHDLRTRFNARVRDDSIQPLD
ncbi:MAG: DNA polymerase III subunit gamma/tau [Candidatus Competibacterales bacterium]|nr:DNA polymerase III subunit gamma/tau [Candidatus Competibacterales bacterium]